jgi:hypothetical protein
MYIPAQINTKAHNIEAALVLNRSSMYDSKLGGVIKCYSLLTLARISRGAQHFVLPDSLKIAQQARCQLQFPIRW